MTGRRTFLTAVALTVLVLLTGCPLPFQFAPSDASGSAFSSNDPANPSVTAAPVLTIVESTSGTVTTDLSPSVNVDLELASATRGAVIFYRTDGQSPVPGESGTELYSSDRPIPLHSTGAKADLRAIAVGPSMYPSQVAQTLVEVTYAAASAPTFSPLPGNFDTDQTVTIATAETGADIYYTIVNGTADAPEPVPGASGTLHYTGPISVAGTGTGKSIAAIAVRDERLDSPVSRGTWTIGYPATTKPTITGSTTNYDGENGTYYGPTTVTIASATPESTIWYTTDGTAPTVGGATSSSGASPVVVNVDGNTTILAIAVSASTVASSAAKASFSFATPPVVFDPSGPTVDNYGNVTLSSPMDGATIYYTTDGSDPSDPTNGARFGYDGSIVFYTATTIRAVAQTDTYGNSAVRTVSYTINYTPVYDDFSDDSIDTDLWTVSTQAFARVVESGGVITAYGYVASGNTGISHLRSTAAASKWSFDITSENAGTPAGGTQGWTIRALDPNTGKQVVLMSHTNDYTTAGDATNANYGDGAGSYYVEKVGTEITVVQTTVGGAIRVVRSVAADSIGPLFRLYVMANNGNGTSVKYTDISLDNVVAGP